MASVPTATCRPPDSRHRRGHDFGPPDIVFPHSGHGRPLSPSSIHAQGKHLFEEWGGLPLVAAYIPEFAAHLH